MPHDTSRSRRRATRAAIAAIATIAFLLPWPSVALVRFDFETPYLVHPGRQVWDFCVVRADDVYHAFYHTIPQHDPGPANADTIWHAVSPDLRHWETAGPVLTSGPAWWDAVAIWAPDVVHDEATGRWAMLYTGVAAGMVQRPCLAWSDDLTAWEKSAANPVFEPDSLTYFWAPHQDWSPFRDPFVYREDERWHMLSTAGWRLGGYPGYKRAIVHHAVSPDLVHWSDAGALFAHDGDARWHDLESVQYLVRDGWHHLFFTEQDPAIENHPTSHLVAADPAGWTMAERTVVDAGWAAEIDLFDSGANVFARLAKDQDPRDESWFVTARFDGVIFTDGGRTPVIAFGDPLGADWPVRSGALASAAPTFGANPIWRNEPDPEAEGHGWFGSAEYYRGPLSGVGTPGAALGDTARGRLESTPFVVTGDEMRLLVGGGYYPETCFVALVDDETGEILRSATGPPPQKVRNPADASVMTERVWALGDLVGTTTRLIIVDDETGFAGRLLVDGIIEREGAVPVSDEYGDRVGMDVVSPVGGLGAFPNPLNGGTELRCEIRASLVATFEVYDLAGRRIWRSPPIAAEPGVLRLPWSGRDAAGRPLPSGHYFAAVRAQSRLVATIGIDVMR